ncbi:glycosyltransferase family 4 protein [Altererythrobacter sp. Root672]|uniref:glycosyltransferase family 4 protein n=1 Tax=Altererythrobacter sp. Root672 TaxID=1736584 RepID=UPI0006F3FDF4|nr:glycosyltransferase family 4 protein [Altererythrobacter sp. Root672]KRA83187.1 colanic acid biosynthesis glycosyl transferase [Altererythrobacter sp. Root672]
MKLALIADVFSPMRSSGAVQMRDLTRELVRQGHEVTMIVPGHAQSQPWVLEDFDGVEVLRLRASPSRDRSYVLRAFSELAMPFHMIRHLRKSPVNSRKFDGIVWYSPTIFLGPIVRYLKKRSQCPAYLILRDIFPQWALDVGLLNKGLRFRLLTLVANRQYAAADVIGVQTPANLVFFKESIEAENKDVEVLQNWLCPPTASQCSINLSETGLVGRIIFVYAGNMGVAQGIEKLLNLAIDLQHNSRIGFVFIGRGLYMNSLHEEAKRLSLENVAFFDEIEPDEIPAVYAQAHVGLVSLAHEHKTHNIPGKFISYMHAGLPVLATINPGNDLAKLINEEEVGEVSTSSDGSDLRSLALSLVDQCIQDPGLPVRCRDLAARMFTAKTAAHQIEEALQRASRRP